MDASQAPSIGDVHSNMRGPIMDAIDPPETRSNATGSRCMTPNKFFLQGAWVFVALVLGLFSLTAAAQQKTGHRIALVIGNDAYQYVNRLEKAGNDANAMARELKAAGFQVLLHRDLNYRGMVKAVETLVNSITGGDQVVVFFAGHGVQIKSGSYLLPIDIEANTESEIEKTAYGLNDLSEKLSEAKAAFTLVVIDACRDNPMKSNGRSLGAARGLSAIEPPKGQMVVYSASKGQQALDKLNNQDSNPNGVFTREFIARMRQPGIRIEDLVRDVQDSVETLARTVSHEQRPAIYNEARGNFYFFASSADPVAPQAAALLPTATGANLWPKTTAKDVTLDYRRLPANAVMAPAPGSSGEPDRLRCAALLNKSALGATISILEKQEIMQSCR